MNPSDSFYARITKLVADNRLGAAFDLLEAELPHLQRSNSRYYHSALLLLQEYNNIHQRQLKGLLVASTDQQDVSLRLLELSQELDRPRAPVSPDPLVMATGGSTQPPPIRHELPPPRQTAVAAAPANSGWSLGKIALYVLAGLGALLVLIIILEWDNIEEDAGGDNYDEQSMYDSPDDDDVDLQPLHELYLANTSWVSMAFSYQINFGTRGNQGTIIGQRTGTFHLVGEDADGNAVGTFDISGVGSGDILILPPFDDDQLTVFSKLTDASDYTEQDGDIWRRN